ncbi:putative disease resistance protein RGA4 [Cornus florida]|uniref:putative disease resistance protein RGA4 n=1 Tax=Cornus florida TaxID=4283 RepID=UPI00289D15A3|nr:putative disease resistance protein RGA4 [Cornus florida]
MSSQGSRSVRRDTPTMSMQQSGVQVSSPQAQVPQGRVFALAQTYASSGPSVLRGSFLLETVIDVLNKLGSMAVQEIGQAWGVKDELDKLKNPISVFTAVLADAEEKEVTNHVVADWLEKLNDAVYDAEHLLEVMTQNKRPSSSVRNLFSISNPLLARNKMTSEIKAIRGRLDAIAEFSDRFQLFEQPIEMGVENRRVIMETHSFVAANNVIGRDGDKMAIIQLLLDSNIEENVSVVAIVGIGRVGKTTLAQLVFNDERITKYFDLKMWVCVSDPFDVNLIAQKMIGSEAGEVLEEGEELRNHLRTKINGNKYLLVLEHMWNEDHENWLELSSLLMGGSRGSKILLTSHFELVANVAGTNSPYFLEGLSEEES